MTTTTTTTTTIGTCDLATFRAAIAIALCWSDRDAGNIRYGLHHIQLAPRDGAILVRATDGRRAGELRVDASSEVAGEPVYLGAEDAKRIARGTSDGRAWINRDSMILEWRSNRSAKRLAAPILDSVRYPDLDLYLRDPWPTAPAATGYASEFLQLLQWDNVVIKGDASCHLGARAASRIKVEAGWGPVRLNPKLLADWLILWPDETDKRYRLSAIADPDPRKPIRISSDHGLLRFIAMPLETR